MELIEFKKIINNPKIFTQSDEYKNFIQNTKYLKTMNHEKYFINICQYLNKQYYDKERLNRYCCLSDIGTAIYEARGYGKKIEDFLCTYERLNFSPQNIEPKLFIDPVRPYEDNYGGYVTGFTMNLDQQTKIKIIGSCIEIANYLNNILKYGFDILFYDCSCKGYLSKFGLFSEPDCETFINDEMLINSPFLILFYIKNME
jgi:hypothetical protein